MIELQDKHFIDKKVRYKMYFFNNKPIYKQISDLFCETILKKEWKENEKIPSVREIAVQVEVSPKTVTRSYTYLLEQGIISNKRGLGYFVTEEGYFKALELRKIEFLNKDVPNVLETIQLIGLSPDDLVKLFKNNLK